MSEQVVLVVVLGVGKLLAKTLCTVMGAMETAFSRLVAALRLGSKAVCLGMERFIGRLESTMPLAGFGMGGELDWDELVLSSGLGMTPPAARIISAVVLRSRLAGVSAPKGRPGGCWRPGMARAAMSIASSGRVPAKPW